MNTQIEHQGKTYLLQDHHPNFSSFTTSIQNLTGIPSSLFKLFHHTLLLNDTTFKQVSLKGETVRLSLGLVGGKGGFGAKMKNEGSKKNKGNNTKFSRDLSGRRLDFAVIKKDCIDFYKKKVEEDKYVEEERKKYKILEMTIDQANRSGKLDKKHKEELEEKTGDIMDAIRIGLAHKQEGKQKEIPKADKGEEQDHQKDFGDNEQEQQEQQKGQKKSKQEKGDDLQQEGEEESLKQVKLSEPETGKEVQQPKTTSLPSEKPKLAFMSVSDKLKSLFKK